MTKSPRWLSVVLVVILASTGPLAVLSSPTPADAQAQSSMRMVGDEPVPSVEPTEGDRLGANFMNVVYVPGKAIICGIGTVGTVALLLVTFGTGYRTARDVFMEGCGGDWLLTGEHLSGKVPLQPYPLPTERGYN